MKTPILFAVSAFAVTAALIKATPALSEPLPAQNVSIVHTSDLDLATKIGRAELDHRLVIAAYEVCGGATDVDLAGRNAARVCRAEVLTKARGRSGLLATPGSGTVIVAASR